MIMIGWIHLYPRFSSSPSIIDVRMEFSNQLIFPQSTTVIYSGRYKYMKAWQFKHKRLKQKIIF